MGTKKAKKKARIKTPRGKMGVKKFMQTHFKHFNAGVCVNAAEGWLDLLDRGGKMLVTLAGAMSTAELGISLAEMIRQDKVHAICCTGANLEEDLYNLLAHSHYLHLPNYRELSKLDEMKLHDMDMPRVTDVCVPEELALKRLEDLLYRLWEEAEDEEESYFPYEYFYQMLESKELEKYFEIDPKNSWLFAAYKKNLPIFVPGWEDSTTGNAFTAAVIREDVEDYGIVKSGPELMAFVVSWYKKTSAKSQVGFFQIGGGIAGDFPICVIPLINKELLINSPPWAYFCQISDSTTSYGSYSGAVPNEKITWGKLVPSTPSFVIESDATIVAPLIFQYILES